VQLLLEGSSFLTDEKQEDFFKGEIICLSDQETLFRLSKIE
jgi:hypothetical protein